MGDFTSLLSVQNIMIAGGAVVALFIFRQFGATNPKAPKKFQASLILFTVSQVYRLIAENKGGLLVTESHGGYGETVGSAVLIRSGRVMIPPRSLEHANALRSRRMAYLVRLNDPTPLTPALGVGKQYMGTRFSHEDYRRLEDLNTRAGAAQAIAQGTFKDAALSKLGWALLIMGSFAGVSWLAIVIMAIASGRAV